jgi:hypoxanthine phosphoribosyltransferase
MIAIGGGGYVPARILRSFLKQPGSPNIPIQAIGLSLYEQLPSTHPSASNTPGEVEQPGTKVTRTQWLDLTGLGEMETLVGKRILIVDEVDDTRTTLEYAVKELEKDVEIARKKLGYEGEKTTFSIFVLHVSTADATVEKAELIHSHRTRIKRRRVISPRICWMRIDTWLLGRWEMYGSATHGRLPTLRNTMRWLQSNLLIKGVLMP